MRIVPINNQNAYKANINVSYGLKLTERLPVSLSPVKNVTNNILKKISILSNRYQYDMVEPVKKYGKSVMIQHPKTKLWTRVWDINKKDSKKYVVVLHGLSHNISSLQDLYKGVIENTDYAVLAPEYTDICYPHKNRKIFSQKTVDDDANAMIKYLDEKGIDRKDIVVVGHSFGGYVASAMAKNFPDIGKLVLISPTDTFKHRIYSIENNSNPFVSGFEQFIVKKFKLAKWRLSHIYETNKLLSKTQCPVDIIYSKRDNLVKQETIENLASKCKNLNGVHYLQEGSHRMDNTKINAVISILNGK